MLPRNPWYCHYIYNYLLVVIIIVVFIINVILLTKRFDQIFLSKITTAKQLTYLTFFLSITGCHFV